MFLIADPEAALSCRSQRAMLTAHQIARENSGAIVGSAFEEAS